MKEYFDINVVKDLYVNRFSKSRGKGIDKISGIKFNDVLESELDLICNNILNENYSFSLYLEKLIIKNRFKLPRILSIPTIRDRIVINQLKEYLHNKVSKAVFKTTL